MTTSPPDPAPAPAPSPAPAPASSFASTVKTVLSDAEIAIAGVVTVGEGVLVALPAGPVHDIAAVALPILAALVAGLRRIGA